MRAVLLLALVGLFIILAGCFEQPQTNEQNNTSVVENKTKPVVLPSFTIVSPEENEEIKVDGKSGSVTVILSTKDLVIKRSGQNKIGEGHFVFVLDDGEPIDVYEKSYTLENVGVGDHTLQIEIVHNDGSSYIPRISKSLHFTVAPTVKEYVPTTYTITIKDFSYEPSYLEVNVGDTVIWINSGNYPRTATCTNFFNTGIVSAGKNASVVMTKPFECDYFSLNYPAMKAHIKVNPTPGSEG